MEILFTSTTSWKLRLLCIWSLYQVLTGIVSLTHSDNELEILWSSDRPYKHDIRKIVVSSGGHELIVISNHSQMNPTARSLGVMYLELAENQIDVRISSLEWSALLEIIFTHLTEGHMLSHNPKESSL